MSLPNTNTRPADEFAKYKYTPGKWVCQIQIQQMSLQNTNTRLAHEFAKYNEIIWTRPADKFAKYKYILHTPGQIQIYIGCVYCFGPIIHQNITHLHIWEPLHAAYKWTVCLWYEGAHINCV